MLELTKLFNAQKQLDEHIEQEHPRQPGEDRLGKKLLALQVEVGELANECPDIFKFWSYKKRNRQKSLEEYVDGLHFVLSIGIEMEISEFHDKYWLTFIKENDLIGDNLIQMFSLLYDGINELSNFRMDHDYFQVFAKFIELGNMLGFTWDEIEAAYFDKNTINHVRQENAY